MVRSPLLLEDVDPQCAEALALLRQAAIEARQLYPEYFTSDSPFPTNSPTPPRGLYLVARLDGVPVGMGSHRPLDLVTTEVRRMFVTSTARRLGVGTAILTALEQHATSVGFVRLVLETGNRQLPAMQLYARYGFSPIEPFGPYIGDATSRCYAKLITKGGSWASRCAYVSCASTTERANSTSRWVSE